MRRVAVALVLALLASRTLLPARVAATDPHLVVVNGRLERDGVRFTGTVVARNADGSVAATTAYRDGLRDGLQLAFDRDGTLLERRPWVGGLRQGTHVGWFSGTGRPRFCYVFDHDLNDGPAYEWADRPGSPPTARFHFVQGREVGMQRVWRVDGLLRANYLASGDVRYGLQGKKECSR